LRSGIRETTSIVRFFATMVEYLLLYSFRH
jgi:hypothetical protein